LPGSLTHLTRRFFDVLTAAPLSTEEAAEVEGWLGKPFAGLFFSQPHVDQRHGYEAARTVLSSDLDDHDVVVAAALHDIGKRHARLGLIGRSFTSVAMKTSLPMTARMRSYRDHGRVAAEELADMSAPVVAIEFARHHHGERPASIPPRIWDTLQRADQPPRAWRRQRHRGRSVAG